jgi:hypothetical protein
LHVDIGIGAQGVELGTRHRVAGECCDFVFGFEAVTDGWGNRSMVGFAHDDAHVADAECVAR